MNHWSRGRGAVKMIEIDTSILYAFVDCNGRESCNAFKYAKFKYAGSVDAEA